MKIKEFNELNIWKISIKLTKLIYQLTSADNFKRDYNLTDQMRRASLSIGANIAEGFEKNNNNEFIRFLKIAKGSVGEVRNYLLVAKEIRYLKESDFTILYNPYTNLAIQIGAFIMYLDKNRKLHRVATNNK